MKFDLTKHKTFTDYISKNGIYVHHTYNPMNDHRTKKFFFESHSLIEVLFLISGDVDYLIEGTTFHLVPGDFIIVNTQELHALHINPSTPYERIVLQFSSKYIPLLKELDLMAPYVNAPNYQHILPKQIVEQSQIEKLMRQLAKTSLSKSEYRDLSLLSLLNKLLIEIHKSYTLLLNKNPHMILSPTAKDELLQSAIDYVNENIRKNITTGEVASHIGFSESYLYHFFKAKMGMSLHKYIQHQKMQQAKALLAKGMLPQNVAEYLGYDYYATFYAQFKKVFKRTPNQPNKYY